MSAALSFAAKQLQAGNLRVSRWWIAIAVQRPSPRFGLTPLVADWFDLP